MQMHSSCTGQHCRSSARGWLFRYDLQHTLHMHLLRLCALVLLHMSADACCCWSAGTYWAAAPWAVLVLVLAAARFLPGVRCCEGSRAFCVCFGGG